MKREKNRKTNITNISETKNNNKTNKWRTLQVDLSEQLARHRELFKLCKYRTNFSHSKRKTHTHTHTHTPSPTTTPVCFCKKKMKLVLRFNTNSASNTSEKGNQLLFGWLGNWMLLWKKNGTVRGFCVDIVWRVQLKFCAWFLFGDVPSQRRRCVKNLWNRI